MAKCPFKEGLLCQATEALIKESRCMGCPYADQYVISDMRMGAVA